MRVWDVSPGYLNRQSLLGEHRELHGLHSILVQGKRGYSRHPETVRWIGCVSGLARRHAYLAAEMRLRGYSDRTPIPDGCRLRQWPDIFVTPPWVQYGLLRSKYIRRSRGRIPLPRSARELWEQHRLSVIARDRRVYRTMARRIARVREATPLTSIAEDLAILLRNDPPAAGLIEALDRMWMRVAKDATSSERGLGRRSPAARLRVIGDLAVRVNERSLLASTALSELAVFAAAREP